MTQTSQITERQHKPFVSYQDFLADSSEENIHTEWVNGEVVPLSPVSRDHSSLQVFLTCLLKEFAEFHDLGEVHIEPFNMKLRGGLPGRSPDILFVSQANLSRLKKNHLDGPADLVIEIVSPESAERDRELKPREYEQGGVREFWLIDPLRQTAEFFYLDHSSHFQPAPADDQGLYHSLVLPGLWIDPAWFRQSPLPAILTIIRQWGLI